MTDTDRIRDDIERTRADLSGDVDALADKVRPSSIAQRQVGKVRGAVSDVKDKLMGAADSASSTGGAVAHAPRAAVDAAQGHPVAVGLIAFGAGLLLSSLFPASTKEQQLASELKDRAEPLAQDLSGAARQAAENLREPAQEAVDAVRETATEAVGEVRGEAGSAAQDVRDSAQESAQNVRDQAGS